MKSHQIFFKCCRCKIRTCVYYNDSNYNVDYITGTEAEAESVGKHMQSPRGDNDEMEKKKQFENYSRRELGGPSGFEGNKKVRVKVSSSEGRWNRVGILAL